MKLYVTMVMPEEMCGLTVWSVRVDENRVSVVIVRRHKGQGE